MVNIPGHSMASGNEGIVLDHVTVMPPQGSSRKEPLLHDICCRIEPHTITLIAGHTGSGKSTLLHTLAGLTGLHSGSISYSGQSLWLPKLRRNDAVHKSIGLVFQYPERQLFAETIEKEFRYSLRPYRLTRTEQSLRIERALDRMALSPSILPESFLTLSEGQKRKAALASTIATEPQWLLLDEPTAGIDPQGIAPLLKMILEQKKTACGGAVVVSHDLDTFLPVADRVIIMHNGVLAAMGTKEELLEQPDVWLRSGVGLPSALELAMNLESRGIPVSLGTSGRDDSGIGASGVPLTAEAMAERILHAQKQSIAASGLAAAKGAEGSQETWQACPASSPGQSMRTEADSGMRPPLPSTELLSDTGFKSSAAQMMTQLHPIAKWLVYIAASTAILMQHHWFGLGVSALIVLCLILASGANYRSLSKPTKPFICFIIMSTLISGCGVDLKPGSWQPERMYFALDAALQTLQLLVRFLLVMVLGVLLAVTTGARKMQAALEHALSFLERFRIPVAAFTFSATLLIRFLPMLTQELERTALIVQSRGKSNSTRGLLHLREVPVFLIPFLLSMMKHAEDLSLALESKGYQLKRLHRQDREILPWTRREWLAVAAGIVLFAVLRITEQFS